MYAAQNERAPAPEHRDQSLKTGVVAPRGSVRKLIILWRSIAHRENLALLSLCDTKPPGHGEYLIHMMPEHNDKYQAKITGIGDSELQLRNSRFFSIQLTS